MRIYRAILVSLFLSVGFLTSGAFAQRPTLFPVRHVLLISVDGLHALDLAKFVQSHPDSALAQLSASGVTYTQAYTAKPSESLQGLMSMVTGGSPISTGIWYEVAYDRALSPPGSNCKTVGDVLAWDGRHTDRNRLLPEGGGLDPAKLPLDPTKGCEPVYPHSFLRVNTIFDVVHSAGMRTAWMEKHPAYEMVNGPSGRGVDDLFTPEISSISVPRGTAKNEQTYETYDDIKVRAMLNEIDGKDHTGKKTIGVPALFGMSFQSVAQGEEIAGYADASGTPSADLLHAVNYTSESIGKMIDALKARNLLDSTLVIISSKFGGAPMDPSKWRLVSANLIQQLIYSLNSGLVAYFYVNGVENVASIWLTDHSQAGEVAKMLSQPNIESMLHIKQILWGASLKLRYNDPSKDPRMPDIVIIPEVGAIYAGTTGGRGGTRVLLTHGGFSDEDTNVALLISNPAFGSKTIIKTPVETTQIAPTILAALGLDPEKLQAVKVEYTNVLPGLFPAMNAWMQRLSPDR